jgi:hypothetical protein
MARNPLIRSYPKKVNAPLQKKSAGILDDHAVRKNVATKEGTIEKVPVNPSDIVNKAYADSAGVTNHALLTNLNWAAAGHTIDADLDVNSNDLTNVKDIKMTGEITDTGNMLFAPNNQAVQKFGVYLSSDKLTLQNSGGTGLHFLEHLYPFSTSVYDLGSSSLKWKDLYLSGDANIGTDANITGDCFVGDVKLEDAGDTLRITPDPAKTTCYWDIEAEEYIGSVWWVPTMSGRDTLFGNIMAIKDRIYVVSNSAPQIYFSNKNLSATCYVEFNVAADRLDFKFASGGYTFDDDITSTGTIKGANYQSGDGSAGITQSETGVTDFDIVIKDGLITSFTKNN